MKTIKTLALLVITLFTSVTLSETALALSPEMRQAIATSKKVEAKKKKYDALLIKLEKVLPSLTKKYTDKKREKALLEKYNKINTKIEKIIKVYAKKNTIYKKVTIDLLDAVIVLIDKEIVKVEKIIEANKKVNPIVDTKSDIKPTSGKDAKVTANIVKKTSSGKIEVSEVRKNYETLVENGVSKKEAVLLAFQTRLGDGLKFCGNFPYDVYNLDALTKYEDAQSEVAQANYNFKVKYYKNYYTDSKAHKNGARIGVCIRQMYVYYKKYNIKQADIKVVYEKHFGKFVPYTTPFYLEGVQPEDIDAYIENHHK